MTAKVVVITGAAGGIGQATVEVFRREGWYVVGMDRREADSVDRYIRADHAVVSDLEAAFEQMRDIEHIAAVVNNAAVHVGGVITDTPTEDWDLTMATNVRAAYLVTRFAHPKMRARGGAIVNVSSVHALATSRGSAAYATSKGALVALTRASAIDLAPDSIRVNAVLPGAVDTPMLLATTQPSDRASALELLEERTPLRRVGRPREIAEAVLFLADDDRSSFITGHALVVDGGALSALSTE